MLFIIMYCTFEAFNKIFFSIIIITFSMSKLPKEHQFIDLSDYGRPIAKLIAKSLKNTSYTPIHITSWFVISGLIGVYCIINDFKWFAAFFLIFKSILDAADGELARLKNTPSHTGRYLDSISDILLNLVIFLAIFFTSETSLIVTLIAFFAIQLQGTLYNYYYVILRNNSNGDTTSRIFEHQSPKALTGEKQSTVNKMFSVYKLLYGFFDKIIYKLDKNAANAKLFPKWFMSLLSVFGLGFQLLIISIFIVLDLKEYIMIFFISLTFLLFVFIGIRKLFFN
jgi:CDP-diacylglycerol---serine O-phosphatidyltransferase